MGKTKILCLGDSYTIGEGVAASDRWPERVCKALKEKNLDIDPPMIIAKTGWTTDELAAAIAAQSESTSWNSANWNVVTLMIGVNDQYRGRSAKEFQRNLETLVDITLSLAGKDTKRVLVISIPDWSVTPFAADRDRTRISAEIDEFNQVVLETCRYHSLQFLDITDVSRQASTDPSQWLADDRLHPGPQMHQAWSGRILPAIHKVLTAQ
jgi:lysophospholipase L1-like esterase